MGSSKREREPKKSSKGDKDSNNQKKHHKDTTHLSKQKRRDKNKDEDEFDFPFSNKKQGASTAGPSGPISGGQDELIDGFSSMDVNDSSGQSQRTDVPGTVYTQTQHPYDTVPALSSGSLSAPNWQYSVATDNNHPQAVDYDVHPFSSHQHKYRRSSGSYQPTERLEYRQSSTSLLDYSLPEGAEVNGPYAQQEPEDDQESYDLCQVESNGDADTSETISRQKDKRRYSDTRSRRPSFADNASSHRKSSTRLENLREEPPKDPTNVLLDHKDGSKRGFQLKWEDCTPGHVVSREMINILGRTDEMIRFPQEVRVRISSKSYRAMATIDMLWEEVVGDDTNNSLGGGFATFYVCRDLSQRVAYMVL